MNLVVEDEEAEDVEDVQNVKRYHVLWFIDSIIIFIVLSIRRGKRQAANREVGNYADIKGPCNL